MPSEAPMELVLTTRLELVLTTRQQSKGAGAAGRKTLPHSQLLDNGEGSATVQSSLRSRSNGSRLTKKKKVAAPGVPGWSPTPVLDPA